MLLEENFLISFFVFSCVPRFFFVFFSIDSRLESGILTKVYHAPGSHSFSDLLYKAPKEVVEELAEEFGEEEEEEHEGDEEGETFSKLLRGQRFPLPDY